MPYVELLYLRRSAFWSLRGYVAGIAGLGVVLLIKLCFYTVKRTTDRYFVILFCDFQRLIGSRHGRNANDPTAQQAAEPMPNNTDRWLRLQ